MLTAAYYDSRGKEPFLSINYVKGSGLYMIKKGAGRDSSAIAMLPLPSSFAFAKDGTESVLYKGGLIRNSNKAFDSTCPRDLLCAKTWTCTAYLLALFLRRMLSVQIPVY